MLVIFRIVFLCAAFFSIAACALITASLFIPDRAPQSFQFFVVSLVVSLVFLGVGVVLLGLQKHLSAIAVIAGSEDSESARELAGHVNGLLAYLLPGGILLCVTLGITAYAILARIEQGFAVFG